MLGALMLGAGFLTGCSDNDPAPFESIKKEPVAGENLTVKINGTVIDGGSLSVEALSDTKANLRIENLVNGYPTLVVPVDMEYTGSEFKYSGSAELPKPSVGSRALASAPGVFAFAVSGVIAGDGSTVSADMNVSLTDFGRGDIMPGDYRLSSEINAENNELSDYTPLFLDWRVINPEGCPGSPDKDKKLYVGNAVKVLGSHVISEMLDGVDFLASGNLSAEYYSGVIPTGTDDDGNVVELPATPDNIQAWLMRKFMQGGVIDRYPREWMESPASLVNWYADDEYVYIMPDINAIVRTAVQAGGDAELAKQIIDVIGSLATMTDEELAATISSLAGLLPEGSDIDLSMIQPSLVREILGWFVTGVPLKYEYTGDYLQLYVDKEMVNAFMPVVLSIGGPLLEKFIAEMSQENPMLSILIPMMVQVQHITDLVPVWTDNTESFRLGLTLRKASAPAKAKCKSEIKAPMSAELESYVRSFIGR